MNYPCPTLTVAIVLLLSSLGFSQQKRQSLDCGSLELDVVYKTVNTQELKLDLYYPKVEAVDYRLVVYTHGGGWAAGSKTGVSRGSFKAVFDRLLSEGFAVASVQYRLCRPDNE